MLLLGTTIRLECPPYTLLIAQINLHRGFWHTNDKLSKSEERTGAIEPLEGGNDANNGSTGAEVASSSTGLGGEWRECTHETTYA